MSSPIPRSLDEVTTSWLTRALGERVPGCQVASVTMDNVVHGTATKARLRIELNEAARAAGLPEVMWLKAGYEPHFERIAASQLYTTEARFFGELRPLLPLSVPECYFAAWDDRQGVVLIEDFGGPDTVIGRSTQPLAIADAAAMLDRMARQHAFWWEKPELDVIGWLRYPIQGKVGKDFFITLGSPDKLNEWVAGRRGQLVPELVRDAPAILRALAGVSRLASRPPLCFLHGDYHIGNTYYSKQAGPGVYDWQAVRRRSWAFDYAYYLGSALEPEARRRSEADLLRHYLERLAAYGVAEPPSFDDAWLAYRRFMAYGLMAWLINPGNYQQAAINDATAARFGAAAADLDTLRLFERI